MKHFYLLFLLISYSIDAQTVGLLQHNSESLDDGYVLFSPISSTSTYLINKCGKQVKTWQSTYRPALSVYLLEDGTLIRPGKINNTTFTLSGSGGIIEKIDWNGNVVWSYTISDATKSQHHDIKVLPNGNILVIAWELKTNSQAIATGRNPLLVPATLWSEQILEIQPSGTNGGTIVWEWHLWDHLVQDYDITKSNFGSVALNPKLLNINYNASATNSDWIHLNSIDYNPILDQIIISSHNLDEIWIIDHSTTTAQAASHSGGNSGNGGDIIYRWGNPAAYNNGTTTDQKLFGQHNAHWIENGLPFENKIMIFNNGIGRPGGNYSTVEIINPPISGYNYTTTLPYLPAVTSWNYNYGNTNNYYAMNISGAQQLSNGNVLMCNGPAGTFSEINSIGTKVWEYISPIGSMGTIMSQGITPTQNSVFRCTFYPSNYAGFANQTLTIGNTIENSNTISDNCNLNLVTNTFDLNDEVTIYPNPASNFISINLNNLHADKIEIYNSLGQIIFQFNNPLTENTISTESLSKGIYIVKISSQNDSKSYKIIKD